MDTLINVIDKITKDIYILKDDKNTILYPKSKIKIDHFKKIIHNPKDVMNTTFDVVHKKWYTKKIRKFIYNNKKYILVTLENKTNDVQQYKTRELELYTDNLTCVYRREMAYLKTDQYIEHALLNKESFAIITIDIDNFKHVNDTYGHATGDRLLKFIAKELFLSTRHRDSSDVVGRIGGDEFILLLANIKEDKVVKKLEQIQIKISEDLIKRKSKLKVTCSIGGYYADMHNYDKIEDITKFREELYQIADKALYESKRNGKNKITLYNKNTKL